MKPLFSTPPAASSPAKPSSRVCRSTMIVERSALRRNKLAKPTCGPPSAFVGTNASNFPPRPQRINVVGVGLRPISAGHTTPIA